jgi:hypothetical protein
LLFLVFLGGLEIVVVVVAIVFVLRFAFTDLGLFLIDVIHVVVKHIIEIGVVDATATAFGFFLGFVLFGIFFLH